MGIYEQTMKIVDANNKNESYKMALEYDKAMKGNEIFRQTMDIVRNNGSYSKPVENSGVTAAQQQNINRLQSLVDRSANPQTAASGVLNSGNPQSAIADSSLNKGAYAQAASGGSSFSVLGEKGGERSFSGALNNRGLEYVPQQQGTDRLGLGVKSIGQTMAATLPMVGDTTVQAAKDFAVNIQNPEWRAQAAKKIKGEILGEVDEYFTLLFSFTLVPLRILFPSL